VGGGGGAKMEVLGEIHFFRLVEDKNS